MSNVDLDKIQGVIESEIEKATTAERKRITKLVKEFAKDLVDEINNGGGEEEEEAPFKKPVKSAAAKKKVSVKSTKEEAEAEAEAEAEEEEEAGEDGPVDGAEFDISEVEDDEVGESDYGDKKVGELRAICKERNVTVPKGYGKTEIAKLLILVDEEE